MVWFRNNRPCCVSSRLPGLVLPCAVCGFRVCCCSAEDVVSVEEVVEGSVEFEGGVDGGGG